MLKNILTAIAIILAIDFIAFTFWVMSGQLPVDSFFIGGITAKLLGIII
jgi:hypothetical protein